MGRRLWETTHMTPKTLLRFGNDTILSTIIENFKSIGTNEIIIVTGFKSKDIISYVTVNNYFGISIRFIQNPEWRRGNGISVVAAQSVVGNEPFVLSMSDHIVSPAALKQIVNHPSNRNLLLVDSRSDEIFDIADATKVYVELGHIRAIGKSLPSYNAIDCGIFRLNCRFFDAMKAQINDGKESISAGIEKLIESNDMEAAFMDPSHYWMDLDTPESYKHGLNTAGKYLG